MLSEFFLRQKVIRAQRVILHLCEPFSILVPRVVAEKEVAIGCFFESGNSKDLVIVMRDEGEGFDPAALQNPLTGERLYASHGRGIHLMHQLVDEVTYFDAGREVELRNRSRQ